LTSRGPESARSYSPQQLHQASPSRLRRRVHPPMSLCVLAFRRRLAMPNPGPWALGSHGIREYATPMPSFLAVPARVADSRTWSKISLASTQHTSGPRTCGRRVLTRSSTARWDSLTSFRVTLVVEDAERRRPNALYQERCGLERSGTRREKSERTCLYAQTVALGARKELIVKE
jgi:hypothetical protein